MHAQYYIIPHEDTLCSMVALEDRCGQEYNYGIFIEAVATAIIATGIKICNNLGI